MNHNQTPAPNALKNAVFCACHEVVNALDYIYEHPEGRFIFPNRAYDAYNNINERYNYTLSFLYSAQYREPLGTLWRALSKYQRLLANLSEYADGFHAYYTPDEYADALATLPKAYAIISDALLDAPRLGVYSTEGDAIDAAPDGVSVYRFDRQILAYIVDLDGVLTPDNNFKIVER